MARTPSTMAPLGSTAPDFKLVDTTGKLVQRDDFRSTRGLLVMFICNHCPYVKHIRSGLAALGRDYKNQEVAIVAINSNDVAAYPDDSPAKMADEVRNAEYVFPYLFDESQEVAKAYGAACTPDFFLYDGERRLVYRGQFDDSRPSNDHSVTGADLRAAIDAVLKGQPVPENQRASIGCNIKWKPGNAPSYFG